MLQWLSQTVIHQHPYFTQAESFMLAFAWSQCPAPDVPSSRLSLFSLLPASMSPDALARFCSLCDLASSKIFTLQAEVTGPQSWGSYTRNANSGKSTKQQLCVSGGLFLIENSVWFFAHLWRIYFLPESLTWEKLSVRRKKQRERDMER